LWTYFKFITQKLHRNSGKAVWDLCKVVTVTGKAKKKSSFCIPELCAGIQLCTFCSSELCAGIQLCTHAAEGCSPLCANRVAFVGSCGLQWDILSWEGPEGAVWSCRASLRAQCPVVQWSHLQLLVPGSLFP